MSQEDRNQIQLQMMAALDGELSPEELQQLEARLEEDATLAAEWSKMQRLKEITSMSKITMPADKYWHGYWQSIYQRIERGLGWILVSIGAIVLLSYGLWQALQELLQDPGVPGFIKWAVLALGIGVVILTVSVLREKLFTRRHDPYREIER